LVVTRQEEDRMQEFVLGNDMKVRRMGFGAMRVTGDGVWGPPKDKPEALRVLRRVVDLGINLIDTADAYGPEVSEDLICEALHPYPDDLVIATKGGLTRTGPGLWPSNGSPAHLRKALEGSLKRLKLERIDLYQLHVVADGTPLEDSIGELARLQEEGKIRHIGVSNQTVDQLERSLAIVDVVSVQNRYNLTFRRYEDVLAACEEKGLGFLPWYPLASSALVSRDEFTAVAAKYDATAAQICLAWLLHRSPVMLPIPGTSSVGHLEENTAARDIALSDEDRATLEEAATRI
jgi:aryl-alcohol dehydrogenase-like predicted oxidoreductase